MDSQESAAKHPRDRSRGCRLLLNSRGRLCGCRGITRISIPTGFQGGHDRVEAFPVEMPSARVRVEQDCAITRVQPATTLKLYAVQVPLESLDAYPALALPTGCASIWEIATSRAQDCIRFGANYKLGMLGQFCSPRWPQMSEKQASRSSTATSLRTHSWPCPRSGAHAWSPIQG